jgi:hypothetical protein
MHSLKASISEYKDCHKGEEGWLFSKGIGIEHFDFNEAGPLRFTVNHACYVVPDPTYCLSCHGTEYVTEPMPEGCPFLSMPDLDVKTVGDSRHLDIPNGVFFKKYSSSEFAMSFAVYTGVSKIHMVGNNPEHSHSTQFPRTKDFVLKYLKDENGRLRFEGDKAVRRSLRDNMVASAERFGVEVVEHKVDLPPYTFEDLVEAHRHMIPKAKLFKYDRRIKKKS